MEHKALSQITPTEAQTLLSFMQAHIPEPKKLNPTMKRTQGPAILGAYLLSHVEKSGGA